MNQSLISDDELIALLEHTMRDVADSLHRHEHRRDLAPTTGGW